MMPFPLVALSKNRSDANFKATKIYFSATKQPLPFTTEHLLIQTCSIKATDLLVQSCKKFLPQKVRSSFVEHCGAGKVDVCLPFFSSSFFSFFFCILCKQQQQNSVATAILLFQVAKAWFAVQQILAAATLKWSQQPPTVNNTTKHSLFQQFLQQYNN